MRAVDLSHDEGWDVEWTTINGISCGKFTVEVQMDAFKVY